MEYIVECPTEVLGVYDHAALVKNFAAAYDVLLRVSEKQTQSHTTNVTLRGSHKELFRLKEAVLYFMKITGQQVMISVSFLCLLFLLLFFFSSLRLLRKWKLAAIA